jgi:hypothetical protein
MKKKKKMFVFGLAPYLPHTHSFISGRRDACLPNRAGIFKRVWGPGIDSKE